MTKNTNSQSFLRGEPLRAAHVAHLRTLVDAHGETAVCKRLRVGRPTLARALAGLGLRRGTLALLEHGLRELGEVAP